MREALMMLAMACHDTRSPASRYDLAVSGAITAREAGIARWGRVGTPAEPYFTISLGGLDGVAAVVLTRSGADAPGAGAYEVGELAFANGGFSGLIVTGPPSHPTGVFWGWSGTLYVDDAPDGGVTGRFDVQGLGYLTASPNDPWRAITARGSFALEAGENRSAPLTGGPGT